MKFLTDKQKEFIHRRTLKENTLYMFPRWGFVAYETPILESGISIDTNPFTQSLDHESFMLKEIIVGSVFVRGNFYRKPVATDFYILKEDLQERGLTEVILYYSILFVPFVIYNLFKEKP